MCIISKFVEDRGGNIAMMAAVLALPMLMLAGVGFEYSRISNEKHTMQMSVDNAANDAARLFQLGPRAEREIEAMINANSGRNTADVNISIYRNKMKIDAKDTIDTPLLSTIGRSESEITASVELSAPTNTSTSSGDANPNRTSDNKPGTKELDRLRRYQDKLEKRLQKVRRSNNRMSQQSTRQLERKLREQLRDVRNRMAKR